MTTITYVISSPTTTLYVIP